MNDICPKCSQRQWSRTDEKYLLDNKQCWECDKIEWEADKLSLKEFERRELKAGYCATYE